MDIEEAKEICKKEVANTYAEGKAIAIQTILDELEKKDKIIEEILKVWKQDDIRSVEELKEYFTNKAEEDIKE